MFIFDFKILGCKGTTKWSENVYYHNSREDDAFVVNVIMGKDIQAAHHIHAFHEVDVRKARHKLLCANFLVER